MLADLEKGRILYQTSEDGKTWVTETTYDDVMTRLEVNETMETNHQGNRAGHVQARYKRSK